MRRFSPPSWVSLPLCVASINLLSNFAVETSNVFIALYARDTGASNLQVGFIAATSGIAFLASSLLFGRLSDIYGRMKYIRIGLGLTSLSYLSQLLAHTPMTLLAARGFVGFGIGINSSVLMAYTYENQKQIGSFVSYGSLGWLIGAVTAAIVKNYQALFIISAGVAFLAFLISFLLKEEAASHIQVARFPLKLIKADYKIYLGFFLRQLGGNAIWTIWPLYQASIGANKMWIAIMEVTNMVGQIVWMRFIERFNPARMFQTGLLLSAGVFIAYGLANHYLQLVPIQLVLSFAYSSYVRRSLKLPPETAPGVRDYLRPDELRQCALRQPRAVPGRRRLRGVGIRDVNVCRSGHYSSRLSFGKGVERTPGKKLESFELKLSLSK